MGIQNLQTLIHKSMCAFLSVLHQGIKFIVVSLLSRVLFNTPLQILDMEGVRDILR